MSNESSSSPILMSCTFMQNSAATGGGLYNWSDTTTLIDTVACNNSPDQINGGYTDGGGNTIADVCPYCPDIDSDGLVNVSDLLIVIDQWGLTNSPADLNFDSIVNVSDLLIVVGNWGTVRVILRPLLISMFIMSTFNAHRWAIPSIDSFEPTSGEMGNEITISGNNFRPLIKTRVLLAD